MSKVTLKKIIKDIEEQVEYLQTHVVAKVDLDEQILALKNYEKGLEGEVAEVAAPKAVEEIHIADAPPEVADAKKVFGK